MAETTEEKAQREAAAAEAERVALQADIAEAKARAADPNLAAMAAMKDITARDRLDRAMEFDRERDAKIKSEVAYYSERNKEMGGTAPGSSDPSIVGDAAKSLVKTVASPLRFVGEKMVPFLPGMQPVATYDSPVESGGPNTGRPNVQQGNVGAGLPSAPPAEVPKPKSEAELEYDKQIAFLQTQQGAPSVKLNQDILQGIQAQRNAAGEVLPIMADQVPLKEAAYTGSQQAGQNYIDQLKVLQGKQAGLFDARRAEADRELAQTKAAESTFDHSRVLRKLGENPVSTAAMSFAAGLVGALKGAAGDMSANQVIGEVDKAVQNDVENQREQYSRMQYGQKVSRTNFLDAMDMGAGQQKALETATIASLDQHKRALQYAEERVTDAKSKASLKAGIGALQEHLGGIRLKIDEKNASMAAAAANNRNAAMAQLMVAKQQMMSGDPKVRQAAITHADGVMGGKAFKEAQVMAEAVSQVRTVMSKATPAEIQEALGPTFRNAVVNGFVRAATENKGSTVAAMTGSFEKYIAEQIKSGSSDMVNRLRAAVQNVANANIKTDAGGSVTGQEEVRQGLELTSQSPEGMMQWLDAQQKSSRANLAQYRNIGKGGSEFETVLQGRYDLTLLPSVLGMDEWDARTKTDKTVEARAAAGMSK